jgi:hypothetical protein
MTKLCILLGTTALIAFAAPAGASTIDLTVTVNGVSQTFTSSTGSLTLSSANVNGVVITQSFAFSDLNPDTLNISSAGIFNKTGNTASYSAILSANDFVGPVTSISFSGSGTFDHSNGTTYTYNYWANADNALITSLPPPAGSTPIVSFSGVISGNTDSFSQNGTGAFVAAGPFSMTEEWNAMLVKGTDVVSRGQDMIATPVPEPATWAMMGMGLAMLAGFRWKRSRVAAFD